MLKKLSIRNYALIQHSEIIPCPHLNIITGETGAGKSIMMGALGLLFGNRADTKVLYNETEKCIVEGIFDIKLQKLQRLFELHELEYEETCIVRREISPNGKSRSFINDTPVNLEVLRAISSQLMDIHSQYDTQQLAANAYQLYLIDAYGQLLPYLEQYQVLFQDYVAAQTHYESLLKEANRNQKELDYDLFLLEELEKAKLVEGEQEQLEEEQSRLENAEEIKSKLLQSIELLNQSDFCVTNNLYAVENTVEKLTPYAENFRQLHQRIASCLIELRDIAHELEVEETNIELDPARLDFVNERLSLIYRLQKKHQVQDTKGLLQIQAKLSQKVGKVQSLELDLEQAKKEVTKTKKAAQQLAEQISAKRIACIQPLEQEIITLLQNVGIPYANIKINRQMTELTDTGIDEVQFLFSANKGIVPQELRAVASGGEFSRLMLCIKYVLAGKIALPTLIFDEIDTGISGEIAMKVGFLMRKMAKNHQIMAITHLPQIAARANEHFYVYKDTQQERTVSRIKHLSEKEHIEEIAQMISGEPPTSTSINNAKELIEMPAND
jgi:DNA repair protein RecN (Recombination protein N)